MKFRVLPNNWSLRRQVITIIACLITFSSLLVVFTIQRIHMNRKPRRSISWQGFVPDEYIRHLGRRINPADVDYIELEGGGMSPPGPFNVTVRDPATVSCFLNALKMALQRPPKPGDELSAMPAIPPDAMTIHLKKSAISSYRDVPAYQLSVIFFAHNPGMTICPEFQQCLKSVRILPDGYRPTFEERVKSWL